MKSRSIVFAALGVLVFGVAVVEGEALLASVVDGALEEPLCTPTFACTRLTGFDAYGSFGWNP